MNYETVDILYRSRVTLLDHLEDVGYNTQPYRRLSPKEIHEIMKTQAGGEYPALGMLLELREKPEETTITKCRVVYSLQKIKQRLQSFTSTIVDPDTTDFDPKTTELIILTLEPIAPNFHTTAYEFWATRQVKVRYFQISAIVTNPLKHMLVPLHQKVPAEEVPALLKTMYAKKTQLPLIRFHEDPIARMIGLIPGDVVQISRPSPTAGECILYRVCVP